METETKVSEEPQMEPWVVGIVRQYHGYLQGLMDVHDGTAGVDSSFYERVTAFLKQGYDRQVSDTPHGGVVDDSPSVYPMDKTRTTNALIGRRC